MLGRCFLLIGDFSLANRLALTGPVVGGASRVLLHLPGSVRDGRRSASQQKFGELLNYTDHDQIALRPVQCK